MKETYSAWSTLFSLEYSIFSVNFLKLRNISSDLLPLHGVRAGLQTIFSVIGSLPQRMAPPPSEQESSPVVLPMKQKFL